MDGAGHEDADPNATMAAQFAMSAVFLEVLQRQLTVHGTDAMPTLDDAIVLTMPDAVRTADDALMSAQLLTVIQRGVLEWTGACLLDNLSVMGERFGVDLEQRGRI